MGEEILTAGQVNEFDYNGRRLVVIEKKRDNVVVQYKDGGPKFLFPSDIVVVDTPHPQVKREPGPFDNIVVEKKSRVRMINPYSQTYIILQQYKKFLNEVFCSRDTINEDDFMCKLKESGLWLKNQNTLKIKIYLAAKDTGKKFSWKKNVIKLC